MLNTCEKVQKKHAYLIMAHNNWYCLEKLLMLLDDERNDIFLHIDAKVKNFDFSWVQSICNKATLRFPAKRIKVTWGTQSQVLTEMLLFETAHSYGSYHYYHLLSGADLPLKTQDEIHAFFEDKMECFITIHENLTTYDYQRISRYHGFFGNSTTWQRWLNSYFGYLQDKLGIDRLRNICHMSIKRGWNWVSLPQNAVEILIAEQAFIRKLTAYSLCADEMYKQIVLLNAGVPIWKDHSCLRLVVWEHREGNHPHTFTVEDYYMLCGSQMLFARKFDEKVDRQIIDKIFVFVRQKDCRENKV